MTDQGRMRERLTLEAPVESADGAGGVVRSHAMVATLWGEIVPLGAREATIAEARGVTVTHRIRIRRRSDMTTRHRLRQGDRLWRIAALSDDASRRFLTIDAEERRD